MEIKINIDGEETEKLAQLGMIDNQTDEEQIICAIHDLIYQKYEIETT